MCTERKWRFDGNENEGCVTGDERRITMNSYCCKKFEEDGEVMVLLDRFVDFLSAGTFCLIFSNASRLSAWKSGWRKIQLYTRKQKKKGEEEETYNMFRQTYILSSAILTL